MDKPFPYAFKNPYLSDQAQWIDMNTILNSTIQYDINANPKMKKNLDINIEAYVKWGENRLLEKPNIQLYHHLADAYFYLEHKDKFCSIIYDGLALYPDEKTLKNGNSQCH